MLRSNGEGGSAIPVLVNKLCNHFAKNDSEVSAHLFKHALCLITSSTGLHTPNDEQLVISQIRKFLQTTKSEDSVKTFDFLYSKLQKTSILQNKCSLLILFLHLGQRPSQTDLSKWNMLQELGQPKVGSVKSNFTFLPDDAKGGSVKKLYAAKSARAFSTQSSRTQIAQSTSPSLVWDGSEHDLQIYKDSSSTQCSSRTAMSVSVPESQLIQEVIYCFQGIEGKILRKEPGGMGFIIDIKTGKGITTIQRGLVERLASVGFLHNQIKQHCDEADKCIGLIGQSLIAILRDELTNYYHLIAMLQAQLRKQGCSNHSELTLRRMVVWVAEPQLHLQWLAYIAEECNDKKGGALITAVHGFLQHGSLCAQKVSTKVLSAVCRPLYLMLSKWLLDGELNDPCGEFFIETRNICENIAERLWHDKYHIRKAMIPSFITMEQAKKMLATGKSLNFLRQVCKDSEEMPGRDALQKLFSITTAEALFSPEQSIELHDALESVYKETSLRVLDLLKGKFKLYEHLQALRRYLLLGQGDFIRHLLELLAPELNKRGKDVYGHTLSAILESAVRVTNAQYEEEDILNRLNVEIMEPSNEDIGWNVFTLIYLIDGPVGTIFQPTMKIYKALFGILWNAKRMEYVLSNLRKQQIASAKRFRKMKELNPITHYLHICTSEMIHFLHQTQYYFLFEVIECSWAEMLCRVNQAESLDDVIVAHNSFLKSVKSGILVDSASSELGLNLRLIFHAILQLESTQECLFSVALKEHEARITYDKKCASDKGFGITTEDEQENDARIHKFNEFLSTVKKQVKTISVLYNSHVLKYLNSLAVSPDLNLQLLSVRLNFNDYYKVM